MAVSTTRKAIREAVAKRLGLIIDTTIDAIPTGTPASGDTLTINRLADVSPDPERLRDAYLFHPNATNPVTNWRRIIEFAWPANNDITLSRALNPVPQANDPAQIYLLLTPDEFNECINEALRSLFFRDRVSVTLVASQNEYNLSTSNTWLQTKGQVIAVRWRHTDNTNEEEVAAYDLQEDAHVLTLSLHADPPDTTVYSLIVEARHQYDELTAESSTGGVTTCPAPLIYAGATVSVLHKLAVKHGERIRRLYQVETIVAEREYAEAKNRWLPPLTPREYIQDERWTGPDIPDVFLWPSW